jgi:excisionase family DNA binding protein
MCYNQVMRLEDTMTTQEAAEALGIGRQRIYDLIKDGRLDSIKVANRIYVSKKSIENFRRYLPWGKNPR